MIVEHESELPQVPPGETAAAWVRLGPDGHLERLLYDPTTQSWLGRAFTAIRGNDLWWELRPEIVFAPDLQTEQYLGPKDSYWGDVSPAHVGAGYAAGLQLQYRQFAFMHDTNWDGAGGDFRMHCGAYLYDFDHDEQVPNFDVPPPTFGWARTEYLTSVPNTNSWWVPVAQPWQMLQSFNQPTAKDSVYPAVYGYMDPGASVTGRMKNIVLETRWAAEAQGATMSISDFLEDAVLNKVFRNTDFTVTTPFLALHTADPTETGATAEVVGNAYARTAATFGSAATGGTISNTADIVFPEATASWGTITHVSLWDAATNGNCLWYGALTTPRAVGTGVVFRVLTGDLDIALD